MAEQLFIGSDNVFNPYIHPTFVLSADEEASGYEVENLGNARRHASDAWRATTANADHWVKVDCLAAYACTYVVIDRASNHLGKRFVLEASTDDFAASVVPIFDSTVPSSAGGTLAGTDGCLTTEGAWIKTFNSASYRYWRLTSKAMGAGIIPSLTNAWLGLSFEPTNYVLYMPKEDEGYDVSFAEEVSHEAWVGTGNITRTRSGSLTLKPWDSTDETNIRTNILDRFARGRRTWIIWSKTDSPTYAVLARPVNGRYSFRRDNAWPRKVIDVPYAEHEPLPLAA